ncbi:MAG: carboxypeptidase-like regulatory domain-containing protein, partial [Spirosomaceae bacterium]|nr:carboxypeptidase-like regulatory domain-containing protein [Spirosomataceae bacterium]
MNNRFKIIHLYFWVIMVAVSASYTNAQTIQIRGSIIDKLTKETISFDAIGVVNDTKGTLSNENGAFQLSVNAFPIQLKISCLGYKTTQIEVTNESELVVKLEQASILLPEATVSLLGSKLMNAVYEKAISDKYEYTTKGFYRQTTKGNGETTEFLEFYSDFLMNPADNIVRYEIQNSRYG